MNQDRSYVILARVQAAMGAAIAFGVLLSWQFNLNTLRSTGLFQVLLLLGLAAPAYFASVHQLLKKRFLKLSALGISAVTVANIGLLIALTGGLDSPYYAFWLLVIVTSGIFGLAYTGTIVGATIILFILDFLKNGITGEHLRDKLPQLLVSLAAAALAEWVYHRSGRVKAQASQVQSLSGQLGEEQLKAQALMNSVGEGVMVVNQDRLIQLFNPAAQALTGWDEPSAQNIQYQNVLALHTGDDQEINDSNDPFLAAWEQGKTISSDNFALMTKAGRRISVAMTVSPIYDAKGQISGGIALFRDVTATKDVERQRNEFISTASHEMRTPVAAIEGYISLAMNANVATIDERARGYLVKAHDSITHLGELFRDLLSVTKMEESAVTEQVKPINVTELLESVVDDMQFTASKKNLTLLFKSSTVDTTAEKTISPIYYAKGNPERLREVLMNLIENAVKFTTEGGITVVINGTNDAVTMSVVDTGPGIAAEDIPHLFQKFYRIDSTATRTIGGTGLGLYLCRTIVERYNGRIWVESKVGDGSSFNISLPRLDEAKALAEIEDNKNQDSSVGHPAPAVSYDIPRESAAPAAPATPPPAPAAPATISTPAPSAPVQLAAPSAPAMTATVAPPAPAAVSTPGVTTPTATPAEPIPVASGAPVA